MHGVFRNLEEELRSRRPITHQSSADNGVTIEVSLSGRVAASGYTSSEKIKGKKNDLIEIDVLFRGRSSLFHRTTGTHISSLTLPPILV